MMVAQNMHAKTSEHGSKSNTRDFTNGCGGSFPNAANAGPEYSSERECSQQNQQNASNLVHI
jgi:hypothetical protein